MMDPGQANSRVYLRQAIDTEIKSLEESTRESIRALMTLRYRHNALAPVLALPPEVTTTIFSFLHLPCSPPDPRLAWLHVAHVCHQWREIALHLPLFWSQVDFTNLTSAGSAEILTRAKKAPLYLEANVPEGHWDNCQFSAFGKELQTHVSYICHLTITADSSLLDKALERLVSPAPRLEYLSLTHTNTIPKLEVFVPDTLFHGTTPRLSCLKLDTHTISWTSPLLKGLECLEMRTPSPLSKPSLEVWMDTLNEMPQLRRLVLHSASPMAPNFQFVVERTVTLPALTHLDIENCPRDCAFALAHLSLPALTCLRLTVWRYLFSHENDAERVLPYIARHAHGPQDTRHLQSMIIHCGTRHANILAWPVPDLDLNVDVHNPHVLLDAAIPSARVALSFRSRGLAFARQTLDATMAVLPLDSLVSLGAYDDTRLSEECWLRHAQRWPLLRSVRLAPHAARGFRDMLLQDGGGRERPLLPSLTELVLIDAVLSACRTLRLCDALMRRVEQGFPLETLDLHTCIRTSHAVRLLSEFVVDVWGPTEALGTKEETFFAWDSETRGRFVHDSDDNSEDEYDYSDSDEEGSLHATIDNAEEDAEMEGD